MKKIVFNKRQKNEFILSSEIQCPKSGIFTINCWVGESGKVILQVSIEVFQALSKKNFGQRWLSPLEQIVPYAYGGVGRYVGFTPVWERTICGFRAGEAWGAQRTCFVDAKVADWRRNLDRHAIAGRNGV